MKLQKILLYSIALSFFVANPIESFSRKKDKQRKINRVDNTIEPDKLVAKASQELRAVLPDAMPFSNRKVRMNLSYSEGIDVSHYQGVINWDDVVSGTKISYVYLKATEGATFIDDTYRRNLEEARRVGLSVGSYHFYRPNVTPEEQFRNLTTNVLPDEQDLVPIIDIEHRGKVSEEQFIGDLTKFIKMVEQYYGRKPMLYSYQNFYNRHFAGLFQNYPWMIAKYKSESPALDDGQRYVMWQYTSKGSIPGIRGHVDRSRLMHNHSLQHLSLQ